MPSYVVEVATEQGIERYPFTLDDDRVLRPQVVQVLEELRQRGVVLKGHRDDELGVYWGGQEVDQSLRLSELGLSPSRPLELRMRPRQDTTPAGVSDGSMPRGVLASLVLGYTGGFIAWIVSGWWTDTNAVVPNYVRLDQLTMLTLGACVGAAVLAGAALRTRGSVLLAAAAGAVLGGVAAAIGAAVSLLLPPAVSLRAFMLVRIAGWALTAGLAAVSIASYTRRPSLRLLGESAGLGLVAGALGGVIFALPGPSDFWQALAFCAVGAAVGVAACGPALWRAPALIEAWRPRVPGVLTLREWPLHEGESTTLSGASLGCPDGHLALYPPPAGAIVGGRSVTEPTYLAGASDVAIGEDHYYVRAMGGEG